MTQPRFVLLACVFAYLACGLCAGQDNGDAQRDTLALIKSRGFQAESHVATTTDGYLLTLHRIPAPGKPVIFLQHGLLDTSATFVLNGKDTSLGYILATKGYDVWLGNSRGNRYSMAHQRLSPNGASQFWDFDFDQHALLDLPASVDKALAVSGQKKLVLIAHSQGGAAALIGVGSVPSLASKVSHVIALAPVTYLAHSGSKLLSLMGQVHVDGALSMIGNREIIPSPDNLSKLLGNICKVTPKVCALSTATLFGPSTHLPANRASVFASHWPDRTSVKNMRHWIQNARSGKFASFAGLDYSVAMDTFPVPVSVFFGGKDYLANPRDVGTLLHHLKTNSNNLRTMKSYVDLAHMDFVWSPDVAKTVYQDILALLPQP